MTLKTKDGDRAYRRVYVRIIPGGTMPEEHRSFHKQGMVYNETGVQQILENVATYIEERDLYKGTEFRMVEVGKGRFNFIGMSRLEAERYAAEQAGAETDPITPQ
jgi:hypothetical protein